MYIVLDSCLQVAELQYHVAGPKVNVHTCTCTSSVSSSVSHVTRGIDHLIAHVVLMTASQRFGNILEVAHHSC